MDVNYYGDTLKTLNRRINVLSIEADKKIDRYRKGKSHELDFTPQWLLFNDIMTDTEKFAKKLVESERAFDFYVRVIVAAAAPISDIALYFVITGDLLALQILVFLVFILAMGTFTAFSILAARIKQRVSLSKAKSGIHVF